MKRKIISFICNYQGISEEGISGDSDLVKDLGMNSIGLIQLCNQVEDDYNIEIDIEDMYQLEKVKDVVNYIELKLVNDDICF